MVCWCTLWIILIIITLLYIFFDVNYFLRLGFTIGLAKYFQKKINVLEKSTIYSVCLTSDVDIFLKHMNNARYIRELDFARFDFYFRCGLYEEIMVKSKGGNAMQGASNIRYRRTIPIFNPYKIETQLVYWDDKAIYLEQRFITLTDGFVRAVALSKQNIIGVSAEEMMKTLAGTGVKKPQVPQDLDHWLKSIEASSAKLRPKSD